MSNKKAETFAEQIARLIGRGGATQPGNQLGSGGSEKKGSRQDIVIGLDFGTSCTKVVLQDPSRRMAWAVPFDALAVKGSAYLLPTKLVLGDDGTLELTGGGKSVLDLKISLMSAPDRPLQGAVVREAALTPRQLCAAYLALVLRRARSWFSTTRADIYRQAELAWQLNLGIPSSTMSDSTQMVTFKQVAQAAWLLSLQPGPLKASDVVSADQASLGKAFAFGLDADYLNVYPEIAAEVSGYARSDARQPGLHFMIDIGASTLDVTTFILFEREDSDSFSFLVTDVQKFGSFYLHRWRVKSLEKVIRSRFDPLDIFRPTPEHVHEMLPSNKEVDSIDRAFSDACRTILGRAIATTKARRAGAEVQFRQRDPAPLPVFLCGGGSLLKFYQRMVDAFDGSLRPGMVVGQFDRQLLPLPRYLNAPGLEQVNYHRLAVAYGLSFRYLDLAGVTPPTDIPDADAATLRVAEEMISKDMV